MLFVCRLPPVGDCSRKHKTPVCPVLRNVANAKFPPYLTNHLTKSNLWPYFEKVLAINGLLVLNSLGMVNTTFNGGLNLPLVLGDNLPLPSILRVHLLPATVF